MARGTSNDVREVNEISGTFVSTEFAREFLGITQGSVIYLVYDQKVEAVRISNSILIEKASLEAYKIEREKKEAEMKAKREERKMEEAQKTQVKTLAKTLENLTPDQIAKLMEHLGMQAPTTTEADQEPEAETSQEEAAQDAAENEEAQEGSDDQTEEVEPEVVAKRRSRK